MPNSHIKISRISWNVSIALLMLTAPLAVAQKTGQKAPQQRHSGSAARSSPHKANTKQKTARDPVIVQVIKDVSPQDMRQIDEKLVSFVNRSTLSVNNPDAASSQKGIVAARNWIKSEFERISAECNGCLEVKTDTFVEQPKNRIPQPT